LEKLYFVLKILLHPFISVDEGVVTVHNVATKQNGEFDEIFGTAVAPDPNFPGELEVTFPGSK
jgi:lipocalin